VSSTVGSSNAISIANIQRVYGSALADGITGGGGSEVLLGNGGNDFIDGAGSDDYITGDAGADTLRGGLGNDTLDGGTGNDADWVDYSGAGGSMVVKLGGGALGGGFSGGQGGTYDGADVLLNFENIKGSSHNDTLIGDAGDNVIQGGAGQRLHRRRRWPGRRRLRLLEPGRDIQPGDRLLLGWQLYRHAAVGRRRQGRFGERYIDRQ
jgi:Ca2+-binding RTX toxin-like protein